MRSCTWVCELAGYAPRMISSSKHSQHICVVQGPGDKDLKRRIKHKQSNEEEYELSRYKPLLRTVIEVRAFLCLRLLFQRCMQHNVGPSRGEARPGCIPLRQRLPAGRASRVQRQADTHTDDLSAERQAQLAPCGAHNRRGHRDAPAGARVRRRRDDLLGDARGLLALEPAREGRHHRCVVARIANKSLFADIYSIFLGSTHALTPRQFVDDLKVLDLSGTGSRAAPNGLRELQGRRPYQAFYDERYFTRDAAPPPQQRPPPMGKSVSARNASRRTPEPSLSGSTLSVNSYTPPSSNGKDKAPKEKKKRFLGF